MGNEIALLRRMISRGRHRQTCATLFLVCIYLLVSATQARSQVAFTGLGFVGFATGLSADGTAIAGTFSPASSNGNSTAFLWTTTTGRQNLGLYPGSSLLAYDSYTQGVSLSATTVVGYGRINSGSAERAFSWSSGVGYTLLATPAGFSSTRASTISGNGNVIFGNSLSTSGALRYEATSWSAGGVELLGTLGSATSSMVYDSSSDGSVAVGRSSGAFYWKENVGMVAIGGAYSADAVSADGKYAVGTTTGYSGTEAYIWSEVGGLQLLGFLSPDHTGSMATDVSADGGEVVGYSYGDSGTVPFLWTAEGGMMDLRSVIAANGGDTTGWSLYSNGVLKISDDGRTIIGNGSGPNGFNEIWRAELTTVAIPEPASFAVWFGMLVLTASLIKRNVRRAG